MVAKGLYGGKYKDSDKYEVDYFYDMESDPYQLDDVKDKPEYHSIIRELSDELERVIYKEEHKKSKIMF